MSEPTLWRQCPISGGSPSAHYAGEGRERGLCPCLRGEHPGLLPVAARALLIEDRGQAIERMLGVLRLYELERGGWLLPPVSTVFESLLAAAEGRET